MIYKNNNEKLDKIKLTSNNFYVVADFDRTITAGDSISTWGVISYTKNIDKNYADKRISLYNKYRPIEIDSTISDEEKSVHMSDWWKAHIALLYEYGISEDTLNNAVIEGGLKYRDGAKEFLQKMNNLNIPVIIISAGIGNIIEEFLKINNDYYPNIKIISNFIIFENGKMKCLSNEPIHSLNKNIVKLDGKYKKKLEEREYILLLGDGLSDLKMISKNDSTKAITVGFLDEKIEENLEFYNKSFDLVITNNGSFDELLKQLIIE